MARTLYTAQAHVVGGRAEGHGVTSDGRLDLQLRKPKETGGDGEGTNPEQLFAIGYAACFEGAIGAAARRLEVEPGKVAIDSEVSLITSEERGFNIAVTLAVKIDDVDDQQAKELVRTAHTICPYSNATRGNVEVTLTANGAPVA